MNNERHSKTIRFSQTLPRPRSSALMHSFSTTLLFLVLSLFLSKSPLSFLQSFFIIFSVMVNLLWFFEFLTRLLALFEERNHLLTRYENSIKKLFQDVFQSSVFILTVVIGILCYLIGYIVTKDFVSILWLEMGYYSVCLTILSIFPLQKYLREGFLYESLMIEESHGLDYGSGMAHSFFHGYLKLIIPSTGTTEPHLKELMENYEADQLVKIRFHKLFILIPKSLYFPTSLKEPFSPSIEESQSLRPKIMTVAGVQNRVYKNSVYKINDNGTKTYVCAEYATPLKTFKDVTTYSGAHSNYYKKHQNDIVLQFYLTLKKIIEEHKFTNSCELIFYDDKDENGRYKDVGQVLLKRIRKLERRQAT